MITLLSSNATNMSPSLVSITDSTTSPPLSKTTNYDAPKRNISFGFATLGRWCHHWWVWQRKYSSSGFAQMHLRRGCSCTVQCTVHCALCVLCTVHSALCSESYPSDKAVDAEKRRKVQRSLVASKCPFKCQITSSVPPSVRSKCQITWRVNGTEEKLAMLTMKMVQLQWPRNQTKNVFLRRRITLRVDGIEEKLTLSCKMVTLKRDAGTWVW